MNLLVLFLGGEETLFSDERSQESPHILPGEIRGASADRDGKGGQIVPIGAA